MFDIGWSELIIIGIVALIAIGPKELPGVLRMVGQWMGKVRRMASEFQGQFNEAMREAEMADIKKQVDEMTDAASSVTSYDPLGDISKQFETALDDKPKADAAAPEPQVATAPPAPDVPAQDDTKSADTTPSQDNAASSPPAPEHEAVSAQPRSGSGA